MRTGETQGHVWLESWTEQHCSQANEIMFACAHASHLGMNFTEIHQGTIRCDQAGDRILLPGSFSSDQSVILDGIFRINIKGNFLQRSLKVVSVHFP